MHIGFSLLDTYDLNEERHGKNVSVKMPGVTS